MRAGEKTHDAGSGRLYLEILADSGPEAVTPAGLGFSAAADVPPSRANRWNRRRVAIALTTLKSLLAASMVSSDPIPAVERSESSD